MQRVATALVILLFIAAAVLAGGIWLDQFADTAEAGFDRVLTAGNEGRFEEARVSLGELQEYMKRCEPWLALMVRRDQLGQARTALAGIQPYLEASYWADGKLELLRAREQLRAVLHLYRQVL